MCLIAQKRSTVLANLVLARDGGDEKAGGSEARTMSQSHRKTRSFSEKKRWMRMAKNKNWFHDYRIEKLALKRTKPRGIVT